MKSALAWSALVLCFLPLPQLEAQRSAKPPKWRIDPITKNDPKAMQKLGYVSYAPIPFGQRGRTPVSSDEIDAHLHYEQILWAETKHFLIGLAVSTYKVSKMAQRRQIRAELTRMQERSGLKRINPKSTRLDPWLRMHLIAQRLEEQYALMADWLGVTDASFPDGPSQRIRGQYMGEGLYLGQESKYPVLIFENDSSFDDYLKNFIGARSGGGQRWNFKEVGSLFYGIGLDSKDEEARLMDDTALHANLVFSTTHNLVDGYKHYNYDLPVWITEGLAHYFERLISERDNTFTRDEGSTVATTKKWQWRNEVKSLLSKGDMAPFGEIMAWREFGQIDTPGHLGIWSRWDYLMSLGKDKFADFMGSMKGMIDSDGKQTNERLVAASRIHLREAYGLNPITLDERWKEWVQANY
ncbi:MAG: hypothetical protein ACYTG5_02900 [Planctomycetota bacterium]|jgi:hypothetical protein